MNIFTKRHIYLPAIALVGAIFTISILMPKMVSAVDSSAVGFDAGNIIDDSVFTNADTMNASQIQDFLNSKVSSCDTDGTQPSEYGGGTRAQWAANQSLHPNIPAFYPPFTCLKDYSQNGLTSAQIIYNAAQVYDINPQTLIVLLQKEQGLVTDTWPGPHQYKSATGYGCPDTAACDSQYYGFTNQVINAAKMFHAIETNSPTWYTPYILGNNVIQYNPDSSCGSSVVNIQNRATQALYNYTPYQPNAATLNAPMGTTVSCGAYGNLDFYRYFTQWFGSTHITFQSLADPRYLQLSTNAYKINAYTGQPVGSSFSAGLQRFFADKVSSVNGDQCVRTQADKDQGNPYCFLLGNTTQLQPVYTALSEAEGTLEASAPIYKVDMARPSKKLSGPYPTTWQRTFVAKTTIDSKTYYVTSFDYNNHTLGGFVSTSLTASPVYEDITPTWFTLTSDSPKYAPLTNTPLGPAYKSGLERKYTSRTNVNGTWYYRTENDDALTLSQAIPSTALATPSYTSFLQPRWMSISKNTSSYTPSTGLSTGDSVAQGTQYKFVSKVTIDNKLYYRTADDSGSNADRAFLASDVSNLQFVPLLQPRLMQLNKDSTKYNTDTTDAVDFRLTSGQQIMFTTKIFVNGQWYLRSKVDTINNASYGVLLTDLEDAS